MPAVNFSIPPDLLTVSHSPPSISLSISTTTFTATLTTTFTLTTPNIINNITNKNFSTIISSLSSLPPPISRNVPGISPFSPYLTSNAMTNETMLTNAIFSHPAIITWASLFSAFLLFAGVVFGLQKVMRRVRARKWIKGQLLCGRGAAGSDTTTTTATNTNTNISPNDDMDGNTKPCCDDKSANESTDKEEKDKKLKKKRNRKVVFQGTWGVYGRGCEFINGSDLSLRADEGVDERSGSWSKRRDKRFAPGGANGRKMMVLPGRPG
ncbi:hypothetical protein TWF506_010717 [Arthrobotrys conoides]|uniref:Uncharacterized protein n=1 Tax=Arthrobotrys conoides TaxID=74498 RepID=A0AAN8RQ49_9PEZI